MIPVLIFVSCLAAVLYVLFGYPALLLLFPHRKPSSGPGAKAEPAEWPSISVILPVRNGEVWIADKLTCLRSLHYPQDRVQIIVVSDGSTDRTAAIVRAHPAQAELIELPPGGKAIAINRALGQATGDILFMTDVRQRIEEGALRWLVTRLEDPEIGVATGELMILSEEGGSKENAGLYWTYEKWIRKRHSAVDSVLGATGAIYVIRRSLAEALPPGTLLDDMLMPLRAFLKGYRIVFVPEALAWDQVADLKSEFRRKVRTLAGVYQLVGLCPELIGPGNRMWFHFVSHKLGRLMLPWALAGMFASSFFLPWPWNLLLGGGQSLFYALALLDPLIPPGPLKRLSSIIRVFSVMMWAAMCAIRILFVPASSLWQPARDSK